MAKNFTVAKFGGVSVKDAPALLRCAEIIKNHPETKVIVVSATSGTTNQLLKLAEMIAENTATGLGLHDHDILETMHDIMRRHKLIMHELNAEPSIQSAIEDLDESFQATITNLIKAATITQPHVDALISYGEMYASYLMLAALQNQGQEASWFDVRHIMITDDNFSRAKPDIDRLHTLSFEYLIPKTDNSLVVTQGFIGRSVSGQTTTLGRGGSDFTAALLAEACQASSLHIWTDVASIYTADPRIVHTAKPIHTLTFLEAAEMAAFGTKVLHPSSMVPAIRQDIPIYVASSREPGRAGTWIQPDQHTPPAIRAITVRNNQKLITLNSLKMQHAHGFLEKVFGILAEHKISIDLVTTSQVSIAFTLDQPMQLTDTIINALSEYADVEVQSNLSCISVVGSQMTANSKLGRQILESLAGTSIRMLCHGASSHNICFLVDGREANKIISHLHNQFIDKSAQNLAA